MHVYVDQTDFVPSCTVVMSHVSIRVKQLLCTPQSHEHVSVVSCNGASLMVEDDIQSQLFCSGDLS